MIKLLPMRVTMVALEGDRYRIRLQHEQFSCDLLLDAVPVGMEVGQLYELAAQRVNEEAGEPA